MKESEPKPMEEQVSEEKEESFEEEEESYKVVKPLPSLPLEGQRQEFYESLKDFVWILHFEYFAAQGPPGFGRKMETHQTAFAVDDGVLMTTCHGRWHTYDRLKVTAKPLSAHAENHRYQVEVIRRVSRCDMCLLAVGGVKDMVFPRLGFGIIEVGEPLLVIGHPLDYPGSGMYGRCVYQCGGKKTGFDLTTNYVMCRDFPRPHVMAEHSPRMMGNVYNQEYFQRAGPSHLRFDERLFAAIPIIQAKGIIAGSGCSGAPIFNLKGELVGMHRSRTTKYEVLIHVEALNTLIQWLKENPHKKDAALKQPSCGIVIGQPSKRERERGRGRGSSSSAQPSKGKGKGKEKVFKKPRRH